MKRRKYKYIINIQYTDSLYYNTIVYKDKNIFENIPNVNDLVRLRYIIGTVNYIEYDYENQEIILKLNKVDILIDKFARDFPTVYNYIRQMTCMIINEKIAKKFKEENNCNLPINFIKVLISNIYRKHYNK